MAWFYLVIAGLMEIGWAIGMKYTDGFTRLWPSVLTLGGIAISLFWLSLAVRQIPIGTAYAVWSGIGAAGTAILGIIIYKEPAALGRLICLAMILGGTIGLKFFVSK